MCVAGHAVDRIQSVSAESAFIGHTAASCRAFGLARYVALRRARCDSGRTMLFCLCDKKSSRRPKWNLFYYFFFVCLRKTVFHFICLTREFNMDDFVCESCVKSKLSGLGWICVPVGCHQAPGRPARSRTSSVAALWERRHYWKLLIMLLALFQTTEAYNTGITFEFFLLSFIAPELVFKENTPEIWEQEKNSLMFTLSGSFLFTVLNISNTWSNRKIPFCLNMRINIVIHNCGKHK